MSGTFPSSPVASTIDLTSIAQTRISVGQSLKRQVRTTGAQRWAVAMSWAPQSQANFAPLLAFLVAQEGQYGSFTLVLPPPFDAPLGSWAGAAPQVNGASQVGSSINLKNSTAGQTGVVKAGDLFKFADTKVYMATADANSDGSGHATVSLKPKLIASPADGESVVYTSVPFTMMLASDPQKVAVRPPKLYTLDLSLIEAY